ncbi:hypothetical protein [Streptomyces sp. x-19]
MRYAPKTLTPYVSARHYFGSRDSAALIQHLMERYEPCAPAST